MNRTKITISALLAFLLLALLTGTIVLGVYVHIFWPLFLTFVVVFIGSAALVIKIACSRRTGYAKACWILLVIALPALGAMIFLIFGINPLVRKQRTQFLENQKTYLKTESYDLSKEIIANHDYGWLFAYGHNNMLKPVYKDNQIEIIYDNAKLLEESIKLIRSAKEYINIQSFIFKYSGVWTRLFFAELIKKANQGIKIRLIYDWLGSWHRVKTKQFVQLQKYGIEVACFNPKGFSAFKGATNYRLHSKFIIVDNKKALYGGSNFADEYLSISKHENHWRDLNFIVTGPIVNSMNTTFINYWLTFCNTRGFDKASKQNIRNDAKLLLGKRNFESNNTLAQLLVFDPNFNEFTLENALLNSFYNAKKSIKIITPYFCPPNKLIEAMIKCHSRGVKIEIISHCKNQKYVQMLNRENIRKLVEQGVSAYEYDGYLHGKLIIIDDEYVLTGSCNIDYRSIYLDFESELIVYDNNFAKTMAQYFETVKRNAVLQTPEVMGKKMNLKTRFMIKVLNIGKSLF